MTLLHLLTLIPATGDNSSITNIYVYIVLGLAVVSALVLGLWKGKK